MNFIFSKELVVTGGGISPGGGSHFSPTKNNYNGPSGQNLYPTIMINDVSNKTGALYCPFRIQYDDGTSDWVGVLHVTCWWYLYSSNILKVHSWQSS